MISVVGLYLGDILTGFFLQVIFMAVCMHLTGYLIKSLYLLMISIKYNVLFLGDLCASST